MKRYVALGSSMAAGPGIRPRAAGSPRAAGRSARNYAHLVAAALDLDLVDVTFSGATTAHVLTESQRGAPPQIDALDGTESLVTVTIGGNDAGYVPMLFAACLPRPLRAVPLLGGRLRDLLDPSPRYVAVAEAGAALVEVGHQIRHRAPRATVLFVDYLTLLPASGAAPPLGAADLTLARHVAATLEQLTADAARITGCGLVCAAQASRDHHAWSPRPWTTRFGLPVPGRPAPLHPNAAGMRAVADLVIEEVSR
ncbi:SGNH/GDSL hydrolase family protein [Mycolicibacterium parafortuitum]|uniref:GDSL family lipase [Nocardia brasiliensis ATCC] n=1 Tax=Mycolicibacterium parafortuitum TaxID=39692 RepID=A0A375YFD3_MYCPF|nr:SGNH/GDSL hydrolase family protein [Mycolicibacterium parafortuitum]SRX79812.1 GDSL family lipase [Nocardia brasiliensis ATCC] [Mycolicibacterium parafortuitum]